MSKMISLRDCYDRYNKEFAEFEVVTGEGNEESHIMLVGEAPGKDEVLQRRPFVGMAGKNLTEFLKILELPRESIFITNAIKHRLGRPSPKTGRIVNRPATDVDIERNKPYLVQEISIIKPLLVITLGNVPLRVVAGNKNITIGELHGRPFGNAIDAHKHTVFALYHPASIIYNQSLKEVYRDDLLKLKDFIVDMARNNSRRLEI